MSQSFSSGVATGGGSEWYTHIAGQPLVIFHQVLILLIDSQHLADPVGSSLSLGQGKHTVRAALGLVTLPPDKHVPKELHGPHRTPKGGKERKRGSSKMAL